MAITWKGNEIREDQIKIDDLNLVSIDNGDNITEAIQKINNNFESIAYHGGGPSGKNGTDGTSGIDGVDGGNAEYIYARTNLNILQQDKHYPSGESEKKALFDNVKKSATSSWEYNNFRWYDHPQGVTSKQINEFVFMRYRRTNDDGSMTAWTYVDPVMWSHWGEKGMDGDGVEYIFNNDSNQLEIPKKSDMDEYQRAIFNIDDFYPGMDWFTNNNKSKAKEAILNRGLIIGEYTFEKKWNAQFNFASLVNGHLYWSDDPRGISNDHPNEYVSIRRCSAETNEGKEWSDFSEPAIWTSKSTNTRIFIIYYNGDENIPETPTGGWWDNLNGKDELVINKQNYELTNGWSDTNIYVKGKIVWMSSGTFGSDGKLIGVWSTPFRMTGEDGFGYEYIYTYTDSLTAPDIPSLSKCTTEKQKNDWNDNVNNSDFTPTCGQVSWKDDPMSVDASHKYVWMVWRKRENGVWSEFIGDKSKSEKAKLWNSYVNSISNTNEYYFASPLNVKDNDKLHISSKGEPDTNYWKTSPNDSSLGWSENAKYLWNIEELTYTVDGIKYSEPQITAIYSNGITGIEEYYILSTQGDTAPAMNGNTPKTTGTGTEGKDYWTKTVSKAKMDATNNCLWNIEHITYTDTIKNSWTTPIVIGIYSGNVKVDLSNEYTSVNTIDNKISSDYPINTTVSVWEGIEQISLQPDDVEISAEEGICGNDAPTYVLRGDIQLESYIEDAIDEKVSYKKNYIDNYGLTTNNLDWSLIYISTYSDDSKYTSKPIVPNEGDWVVLFTERIDEIKPYVYTSGIQVFEYYKKSTYSYDFRHINKDIVGKLGIKTNDAYKCLNGHILIWDGEKWFDKLELDLPENESKNYVYKKINDDEKSIDITIIPKIGITAINPIDIVFSAKDKINTLTVAPIEGNLRYELDLSENAIKYTSSGDLSIDDIKVGVIIFENNIPKNGYIPTSDSDSDSDIKYKLSYSIDGGYSVDLVCESENLYYATIKKEILKTVTKSLKIILRDSNDNLLDKETIYPIKDGEPGKIWNRVYAQFDDSWGVFKSIGSISSDGEKIYFYANTNDSNEALTYSSPKGADEDHCIEVMSERLGDTGTWTLPVITSRQFSDDEIQSKINAEIQDAQKTLQKILEDYTDTQISSSLCGYAKTSELNNYVTSAAFDLYESNANKSFASKNAVVANTNSITGLTTEMATLNQTVSEGLSKTSIINKITNNSGESITSYIFSEANKDDSTIKLGADHITLTGNVVIKAINGDDNDTTIDGSHITTGTITAKQIKANDLVVGKHVKMGDNAKISWKNVEDKEGVATKDDVEGVKNDLNDYKTSVSNTFKTCITQDQIATGQIIVNKFYAKSTDNNMITDIGPGLFEIRCGDENKDIKFGIKIIPKYTSSGGSTGGLVNAKNVPILYVKYGDTEYTIEPNMWKKLTSSSEPVSSEPVLYWTTFESNAYYITNVTLNDIKNKIIKDFANTDKITTREEFPWNDSKVRKKIENIDKKYIYDGIIGDGYLYNYKKTLQTIFNKVPNCTSFHITNVTNNEYNDLDGIVSMSPTNDGGYYNELDETDIQKIRGSGFTGIICFSDGDTGATFKYYESGKYMNEYTINITIIDKVDELYDPNNYGPYSVVVFSLKDTNEYFNPQDHYAASLLKI